MLGGFWILLGVVCSEWVLPRIFSADAAVATPLSLLMIRLVSFSLVIWGSVTICAGWRQLVQNLNLSLVIVLLIGPFAVEAFLRVGIAANVPMLKAPVLYFHKYDDNMWIARHLWTPTPAMERARQWIHPTLGWSQEVVTQENPRGLRTETITGLESTKVPKLLFYGDSFVQTIPTHLEEELPEMENVHLGVGGYATDQIYLMFHETHDIDAEAVVVMGFMLNDMGRSLLTVRNGRKPWFEVNDHGGLDIKGIPIEPDQSNYYQANKPAPVSFLASLIMHRFQEGPATTVRRNRIQAINSRILELVKDSTASARQPLLFIMFYPRHALELTTWEEQYLRSELQSLEIPFVDTKIVLHADAEENSRNLDEYYLHGDGHHTQLAEQVISKVIAERVRELRTP